MKTTAERLAELAIAYAQHRKDLRDNGLAIKRVQDDGDGAYYDLKPFRERYWSDPDVHDLVMGEVIVWRGWLHAVETCDPDNENWEDCGYRATAKLMDERRDILRKGAHIRAAFTKIGDKLLKEVTT